MAFGRKKVLPAPRLRKFSVGSNQLGIMVIEGELDAVGRVAAAWERAGKITRWTCSGDRTTLHFTAAVQFSMGGDEYRQVFAELHAAARKIIDGK
jgi:hypothetical protein